MKNTLLTSILLLATAFGVNAQTDEIDAITVPLERYLEGHVKGDREILGKALHSEGRLNYLRNGAYNILEFPEYLARMKLRDPESKVQRIPYIKSIEVTGNVAVGKLVLDYSTIVFTDYMTLLKINGEWKITNKIAYSVREPNKNKAINTDIKKVKIPLENYLMIHRTGNAEFARKAFHKNAKIMSISKGKYSSNMFQSLISDFKGNPTANKSNVKHRIERIDVTGNVAIGKVILDYANLSSTHYLSLLNVEGEWKIVNDAYFIHEDQQALIK